MNQEWDAACEENRQLVYRPEFIYEIHHKLSRVDWIIDVLCEDTQQVVEVTCLFLLGSSEDPVRLQQTDLDWRFLQICPCY